MQPPTISLRLATEADQPFLRRLFHECRFDEFAALGNETATRLLASQFEIQDRSYRARFDVGGSNIITVDDLPVGRIWVHCDQTEWLLVDLAILPENRNTGLGTIFVQDLIAQAQQNDATVRLEVLADNIGAQRLYFRHGFMIETAAETVLHLVHRPPAQRAARFEAFRRRVLADPALFAELSAVTRGGFAEAVVDVARRLGEDIDVVDVNTAQREARRIWTMQWV